MKEFLDKIANNDQVLIGLVILLIVLIVVFFIVLLFSGKGKKKANTVVVPENNDNNMVQDPNVNFNQNEYIKETTAEFELAPIEEIKPTTDEFVPEVVEETPSHKFESIEQLERQTVPTFSFDELSKMISAELENYDSESSLDKTQNVDVVKEDTMVLPKVTFVDSFKEETVEPMVKTTDVIKPQINDNFSSVYTSRDIKPQNTNSEIVLPKRISQEELMRALDKTSTSASTETTKAEAKPNDVPIFTPSNNSNVSVNGFTSNYEAKPTSVNPVNETDETPIFARFNQETYDINPKD